MHTLEIPVLRRLRQGDFCEFEASLGYIVYYILHIYYILHNYIYVMNYSLANCSMRPYMQEAREVELLFFLKELV